MASWRHYLGQVYIPPERVSPLAPTAGCCPDTSTAVFSAGDCCCLLGCQPSACCVLLVPDAMCCAAVALPCLPAACLRGAEADSAAAVLVPTASAAAAPTTTAGLFDKAVAATSALRAALQRCSSCSRDASSPSSLAVQHSAASSGAHSADASAASRGQRHRQPQTGSWD